MKKASIGLLILLLSLVVLSVACQPRVVEVTRLVTETEQVEVTREVPLAPEAAKPNTLTAIHIDEAILDAAVAFWSLAPRLVVSTVGQSEEEANGPDLTLQAIYDDQYIVIRAEWSDPTQSLMKNAWTWDGTQFIKSGNEDRIMFIFPIGINAEFASQGCASACHNQADDEAVWYMGTDGENIQLDQWHWKSARTHPYNQADDKWVGPQVDPADVESAHHGDAKESGGEVQNINEEGTGPLWMHGTDLTASFIFAGEEVPIDTSLLEPGTIIPGYVVTPMVGSRGDVTAIGFWENGRWVVVIMRVLDTGHEDDVAFVPPRPVPFGVSLINDGGGLDHTNAPDVITLEWN